MIFAGGIPLKREGKVVGAIGPVVVTASRTMPSRQLAQLHFNDVTMAGH